MILLLPQGLLFDLVLCKSNAPERCAIAHRANPMHHPMQEGILAQRADWYGTEVLDSDMKGQQPVAALPTDTRV